MKSNAAYRWANEEKQAGSKIKTESFAVTPPASRTRAGSAQSAVGAPRDAAHKIEKFAAFLGHPPQEIFADDSGLPVVCGAEQPLERRKKINGFHRAVLVSLKELAELIREHAALLPNPFGEIQQRLDEKRTSPLRRPLIEELPTITETEDGVQPQICAAEVLLSVAVYSRPASPSKSKKIYAWTSETIAETATALIRLLLHNLSRDAALGSKQHTLSETEDKALLLLLPECLRSLQKVTWRKAPERRILQTNDAGPNAYCRAIGAAKLSGVLSAFQYPENLADAFQTALPTVLANVDDVSPAVRKLGIQTLHFLATEVPATALHYQRVLLLHEAVRVIDMAEETTWQSAASTATTLVCKLEGSNAFGEGYGNLMKAFLDKSNFASWLSQPAGRVTWFKECQRVIEAMGISSVAFHSRLIPILVDWSQRPDKECCVASLEALLALVCGSWPKLGLHGGILKAAVERQRPESASEKELVALQKVLEALDAAIVATGRGK